MEKEKIVDLFSQISHMVESRQINWEDVLKEIENIKRQYRKPAIYHMHRSHIELDALPSSFNQHHIFFRRELFSSLSPDAKSIVRIILNASENDFRSNRYGHRLFHKGKITKNRVFSVMREHYAWKWKRIKKAAEELKEYCRQLNSLD